jgi:hypothetical protein
MSGRRGVNAGVGSGAGAPTGCKAPASTAHHRQWLAATRLPMYGVGRVRHVRARERSSERGRGPGPASVAGPKGWTAARSRENELFFFYYKITQAALNFNFELENGIFKT